MGNKRRRAVDEHFYHIFNRGHRKEPIFHEARDYERFLWAFTDAAAENDVGVHVYCLMPNHFHFLVRQNAGGSIEKMMRSFGTSYSMYFNRAYGYVGSVFQGRYGRRRIENEADLLWVSRYIHRNPVEAGLAEVFEYKWSSSRAFLGEYDRFGDPEPILEIWRAQNRGSYATFCEDVERTVLPGGSLGYEVIVTQ